MLSASTDDQHHGSAGHVSLTQTASCSYSLLQRLGASQSVEDTERVVREAMTAPAAAAAAAARPTLNFDNDDTLDTFMDEQRRPGSGSAAFVAEDEW